MNLFLYQNKKIIELFDSFQIGSREFLSFLDYPDQR